MQHIYLDHAATSFPKPAAVAAGMYAAARTCAGYGRSAHPAAIRASEIVYACRSELAALFRLPNPNAVAFTMNATMALNYAIDAAVKERAEVCISAYEHNSVVRPLVARRSRIDVVLPRQGQTHLEAWEEHIKKRPSCVIVNHVSNVFGFMQPIEEIGALCQMYQIPLIRQWVQAEPAATRRSIGSRRNCPICLRAERTICLELPDCWKACGSCATSALSGSGRRKKNFASSSSANSARSKEFG